MRKMPCLIFIAVLISSLSGCNSKISYSEKSSESDIISTEKIDTSVTTEFENNEIKNFTAIDTTFQESAEYTERQIIEAVCVDMYGYVPESYEYENHADYLMKTAETITERFLGKIASEEDAIEKTKTICIERGLNNTESDYIEVGGVKMKYERDNPPFNVKYYEEYDTWFISPNPPSGTREDGVKFSVPAMPMYLIIRGNDGKILGALI